MKINKPLNKAALAFLIFTGILTLSLLLHWSGFFQPVEETLLDQKFRMFDREVPEDRISLLMIDQPSLDSFRLNHGIYWPLPREIYGVVHHYLVAKEVPLVVYDILFDQPDFDRQGMSGAHSDRLLEQLMGTYHNSVLALQTGNAGSKSLPPSLEHFTFPVESFSLTDSANSISNLPIPPFLEAARGLGSVAIPSENETVIRSVPLLFDVGNDESLPSLGMAAYLHSFPQNKFHIQKLENELHIDSLKVPLLDDGKYLVNWYKKGGASEGTFNVISFYSLFEAALQFRITGEARNDQFINLKDNIVFIGASAAGLSDIKSTPMSPFEPFPGVEIHAVVTQNLLDKDFIAFIPDWLTILLLILLSGFIVTVIFWAPSKINIPISLLIIAGTVFLGLSLFLFFRIWFPTAEFTLITVFAVTATYITKYVSEDAQKKAIRSAFNLYLQKELVEQIIEAPEMLKLGGEKKELTVLFSDLAGFTTISENTEPEELVAFLNEYLSEMTDIVFKNKGTLDKFIGDAIMAFWGAPVPEEEHAYLACKCVLEMEEKMKQLQKKWGKAGMPAPHVRYGLNTGEMVVGNMGSDDRFSYTVLGDNVNLGARLEPANKDFGTKILISEATRTRVHKRLLTREVALLKAKGKNKPIRIFELICERSTTEASKWKPFLEVYEKGLQAFYDRKWKSAETLFNKALDLKAEDRLAQIYLNNSRAFSANPPGTDWDGSYQQINK